MISYVKLQLRKVFVLLFLLILFYANGVWSQESEPIAWKNAKNTATLKAFHSYLYAYPEGEHTADAKMAIDQIFKTLQVPNFKYLSLSPDSEATGTLELKIKGRKTTIYNYSMTDIREALFLKSRDNQLDSLLIDICLYSNHPFFCNDLSVNTTQMVQKPIIITISDIYNKNVAIPADDSQVPFILEYNKKTPFTRAIGVTWKFISDGLTIETSNHRYVTQKPGATIKFTKYGTVIEGFYVQKIPGTDK